MVTLKKDPEELTTEQFKSALQKVREDMHERHFAMLRAHYYAPGRSLNSAQLAAAVGYKHFSTACFQYGGLASKLCDILGHPAGAIKLYLIVSFIKRDAKAKAHGLWIMRPQLAEALEELGWVK
jgi:hypothetical protein